MAPGPTTGVRLLRLAGGDVTEFAYHIRDDMLFWMDINEQVLVPLTEADDYHEFTSTILPSHSVLRTGAIENG